MIKKLFNRWEAWGVLTFVIMAIGYFTSCKTSTMFIDALFGSADSVD